MENKEKKESFQRNQNKFEFFFCPETVAGDIGRFILGSIILLVNLGALGLVLIGLAAIFDSNTPGTGTAIILLLVAILIFCRFARDRTTCHLSFCKKVEDRFF